MRRILLDTNVLLLYLVGLSVPQHLSWKRLAEFDVDDVKRLQHEARGHTHVGLPNLLTEASNFLGSGKDEAFQGAAMLLGNYCQKLDESFLPSMGLAKHPLYTRLGLSDTAIYCLSDSEMKVVTVDFELSGLLTEKGVHVVNLRHYKTPRGR